MHIITLMLIMHSQSLFPCPDQRRGTGPTRPVSDSRKAASDVFDVRPPVERSAMVDVLLPRIARRQPRLARMAGGRTIVPSSHSLRQTSERSVAGTPITRTATVRMSTHGGPSGSSGSWRATPGAAPRLPCHSAPSLTISGWKSPVGSYTGPLMLAAFALSISSAAPAKSHVAPEERALCQYVLKISVARASLVDGSSSHAGILTAVCVHAHVTPPSTSFSVAPALTAHVKSPRSSDWHATSTSIEGACASRGSQPFAVARR
mmetsp:Transcript_7974/g.20495  ORF Transcript_7974/g.20495 Transcript_7974/m.20495 type:complete len:262 (+) Transcript_7974:180-965(+)